jgi:hypothetical protein
MFCLQQVFHRKWFCKGHATAWRLANGLMQKEFRNRPGALERLLPLR